MDWATLLVGTTGGGLLVALVGAVERWRQHRIAREDTTFTRLGTEAAQLSARIDVLEAQREAMYVQMVRWREQAHQYRIQLVTARIPPVDDRELFDKVLFPAEDASDGN